MSRDRILVLYNTPILPHDHPEACAEHDVLDTVNDIVNILEDGGYSVKQIGIKDDPQPLIHELQLRRPKAVFNLFEGLPGKPYSEAYVASILEWTGVPFTGCPSVCLAMCANKIITKHVLKAAGITTPQYTVIYDTIPSDWYKWPAIIKPACQDASIGIEQQNVVTNINDLKKQVEKLTRKLGLPVLVEQLIIGREFHINLIQNAKSNGIEILPPSEIIYPDNKSNWPIYTFTAKWNEDSDEHANINFKVISELDNNLEQLQLVAERAYIAFYCQDYIRIDVRIDQEGIPYVLDINPNPYLNSLTLVDSLDKKGKSQKILVLEMIESAISRGFRRKTISKTTIVKH